MAKGNEFFTALNAKRDVIKSDREIVFMLVTGMTPATIGVSQPAAATRSRSRR